MRNTLREVSVGQVSGCQCGGMCGRCAPPEYRQAMQAMAQRSASGTAVGNLRATEVSGGGVRMVRNGLGDLVMVVQ